MEKALGIDPGDITGYAKIERRTGRIISLEMYNLDDFQDTFMHDIVMDNITLVVIEDYKLDKWRAQQQGGSQLKAVQIIGMVKLLCRKYHVGCIVQDRQKRKTGELWSQLKEPSNHAISHPYAALNHVLYYVMRYEGVPTAQERANQYVASRAAKQEPTDPS